MIGAMVIGSSGVMNVVGPVARDLYGPLTNMGRVNILGNGTMYLQYNGADELGHIVNQSGGV
ncbi:MAG TPA: hypothetical protein VGE41_13830, partial [Verrucomicrobiae bacterium]